MLVEFYQKKLIVLMEPHVVEMRFTLFLFFIYHMIFMGQYYVCQERNSGNLRTFCINFCGNNFYDYSEIAKNNSARINSAEIKSLSVVHWTAFRRLLSDPQPLT